MTDFKALNEKLMKFCGIECGKADKFVSIPSLWGYGYYLNGKRIRRTCPDLVHELDAQKKYIHPKLDLYHIQKNYLVSPRMWNIDLYEIGGEVRFSGYNESESLAFVLAVEKLIDSMDGKNAKINS
jgi:hypothetical protein